MEISNNGEGSPELQSENGIWKQGRGCSLLLPIDSEKQETVNIKEVILERYLVIQGEPGFIKSELQRSGK